MEVTCASCGKTFDDTGDGRCPHCNPQTRPAVGPTPPTVDLSPLGAAQALSGDQRSASSTEAELTEIACPGCRQSVLERDLSIPKGLAAVIDTAIKNEESRRYHDAGMMLAALGGPVT